MSEKKKTANIQRKTKSGELVHRNTMKLHALLLITWVYKFQNLMGPKFHGFLKEASRQLMLSIHPISCAYPRQGHRKSWCHSKKKINKNNLIIFNFSSNSLVLLLIYLACTPYLFTFHNFVVTWIANSTIHLWCTHRYTANTGLLWYWLSKLKSINEWINTY